MAKLTKGELIKFSKNLKNDWLFDIEHYVAWGKEKQLMKQIHISDVHSIILHMEYYEKRHDFKTMGYIPVIRINLGTSTGTGFLSSAGWGKTIELGPMVARRNYSFLEKQTNEWNDEKLIVKFKELFPKESERVFK